MKNYFKLFTLLICVGIFSCSKSDDSGNNGGNGGGGLDAQATYRITFTTNWTDTTHPTDYPDNASFGRVFIAAHSPAKNIFIMNTLASDGLKLYAEDGDLSGLISEHSGGEDDTAMTIITGSSSVGTSTTVTFDINVTPTNTRISFVSKISPSPDWFVGVPSFNLVNGDVLIESASVRLYPLDAGSDSGMTYESPDNPEPGPITQIQGLPFSSGSIQSTQVGTLSIERIDN
ncbi:MAG: spondin domain-containing protein [Flavobacteriaceae bacterium]